MPRLYISNQKEGSISIQRVSVVSHSDFPSRQQQLLLLYPVYILLFIGMADVSCKRLQRLKYYVDKEFLTDNFWVWEGAVGRIANNYIYNSTSRGIVPNPTPSKYWLTNAFIYNTWDKVPTTYAFLVRVTHV